MKKLVLHPHRTRWLHSIVMALALVLSLGNAPCADAAGQEAEAKGLLLKMAKGAGRSAGLQSDGP